jgi:hypothetical protein
MNAYELADWIYVLIGVIIGWNAERFWSFLLELARKVDKLLETNQNK